MGASRAGGRAGPGPSSTRPNAPRAPRAPPGVASPRAPPASTASARSRGGATPAGGRQGGSGHAQCPQLPPPIPQNCWFSPQKGARAGRGSHRRAWSGRGPPPSPGRGSPAFRRRRGAPPPAGTGRGRAGGWDTSVGGAPPLLPKIWGGVGRGGAGRGGRHPPAAAPARPPGWAPGRAGRRRWANRGHQYRPVETSAPPSPAQPRPVTGCARPPPPGPRRRPPPPGRRLRPLPPWGRGQGVKGGVGHGPRPLQAPPLTR